MRFLRGRYADLTGHRTTNGTSVDQIVRSDRHGPIWSLICSCRRHFIVPHSRIAPALASGAPVYCGKCHIPLERTETIADVIREDRQEREQAEREQAERQAEAAKQAEKERAEQWEKSRWRTFANHLFNSGIEIDSPQWVSFSRWCSWGSQFQDDMLTRIEQGRKQL